MRQIKLYIADQLADLSDNSFILMNYTAEDLSNPAIVKNSFSQQITLDGTANNNRIFGEYFRTDKRVSAGGFNPSSKTPFEIRNELNEIIESGYVKLDEVTRSGDMAKYKVSLYGGLGSFFYALSYDTGGNKRSLADLDYLGTGNPSSELDFAITANAVKAAWQADHEAPITDKFQVINFAPAYNGIPEGFDAKHGIITCASSGLPTSKTDGGTTYAAKNGLALVTLANDMDEWAVKDLRCYLQRPVFSLRAFLKAIADPSNNGGYTVDVTELQSFSTFKYGHVWMTLPMLPSLGTYKKESGDLSLSLSSSATIQRKVGEWSIVGSVPSGSTIRASVNCYLHFNGSANLYPYGTGKANALTIQLVAVDASNNVVGGSDVYTWVSVAALRTQAEPELTREIVGTPNYHSLAASDLVAEAGGYKINRELGFSLDAVDAAKFQVIVSAYALSYVTVRGRVTLTSAVYQNASSLTLYNAAGAYVSNTSEYITAGVTLNSVTYTSTDTLRSGAHITKAMLLSTEATPADYLLSFAKIFGLCFRYDPASKKVTICTRNSLYIDETIDLSGRVDTGSGVTIQPIAFDAKWYDFALEGVGGAFLDEYEKTEGIKYGAQRVNTGYDFNAESKDLMSGNVFKNAATILARSRYFNYIFASSKFQPSPFVDTGNKYTLWAADDATLDVDISCPPSSASVTYYNENGNDGYDIEFARKLELRTADGKPVDGANVLCYLEGFNEYRYFKVTDDTPEMNTLNEGTPCWLLDAGPLVDGEGPMVPSFARYTFGSGWLLENSLDFGEPRQIDIPNVTSDPSGTVYARAWANYLADRYDVGTKVMTCKVSLAGLRVSQELLRKFYWYDGSIWVLNAIRNYSLTTYDLAECEFVQVQDKSNYTNGQDY